MNGHGETTGRCEVVNRVGRKHGIRSESGVAGQREIGAERALTVGPCRCGDRQVRLSRSSKSHRQTYQGGWNPPIAPNGDRPSWSDRAGCGGQRGPVDNFDKRARGAATRHATRTQAYASGAGIPGGGKTELVEPSGCVSRLGPRYQIDAPVIERDSNI